MYGLDQRTIQWPLLDMRLASVVALGYMLTTFWGNQWMKNGTPYRLMSFTALHNLTLFVLSIYMCCETLRQASIEFEWSKGKIESFICPQIKQGESFSPAGYRLAFVLWIHYLSKAYEFVDTFIMVLKKNTRQLSFLHIYHHALTFFPVWWSVILYGPGGAAYFCCALNSFIHIWMYGYYFLAGLGLKVQAMKPVITYSQIIQFVLYISQASYMLRTDCYRPRLTVVFLMGHSLVLFFLFLHFAYKTYWKKAKDKAN